MLDWHHVQDQEGSAESIAPAEELPHGSWQAMHMRSSTSAGADRRGSTTPFVFSLCVTLLIPHIGRVRLTSARFETVEDTAVWHPVMRHAAVPVRLVLAAWVSTEPSA